jgi:hypothetical protein
VIDDQGRLFERVNLVDAAIGGFILILVPLAYASYLLFRPPAPQITSVEPAPLTLIEERAAQGTRLAGKLKVRGTGLRPVLRASIGSTEAVAFIFENPTSADVLFGDVPVGTHDLVLYDGITEVARARDAVTVPERPAGADAWVALAGVLLDLDESTAAALSAGDVFEQDGARVAEILAIGPAAPAVTSINARVDAPITGRLQRPALVAVRCDFAALQPRECLAGGRTVAPGVAINVPGGLGRLRLMIDSIVPVSKPARATMRVRLYGPRDALSMVRQGDVDQPHLAIDQRGAVISEVGPQRAATGELNALLPEQGPAIAAAAGATLASLEVSLTAGLDNSREGWRYRGDLVRGGSGFTFTTPAYTLRGVVLNMTASDAASAAALR